MRWRVLSSFDVTLVNAQQVERKCKTLVGYKQNKVFLYKNTLQKLPLNKLCLWQNEYIYYELGSRKKYVNLSLFIIGKKIWRIFVSQFKTIAFYYCRNKDKALYFSVQSESNLRFQDLL